MREQGIVCRGFPSYLISLEEFSIKLYRPLRFNPRARYNLKIARLFFSPGSFALGRALEDYFNGYLSILAVTSTSTNLPSEAKPSTKQNSICAIPILLFFSRRPLSSSTF